ncbi:hypothetical protein CS063_16485 [Sporanaerobium hydrogeniformans]|uniref:Uncharacterized protein n=1 Tax=Sporanaerobium hydrogeniformans TaxID=3072179 RepID=A0AC61D9A4_9FIRM|nr:hypothetical protein [Sporanaerobium hydrogeniformans]PHV69311.1 hypothetical protein CS063_16485 [Sporanaerobium hydrogeniformans]
MESDDSDSDDTHNPILFTERVEASNEEKQEIFLSISSNDKVIGYINAIILHAGLLKDATYVKNKLKCKNKEDEKEILNFYNRLKSTLNTNVIFYITDFFLEKPYRGNGLGGCILKALPPWIRTNHPEVNDLYLFPYPLEKNHGKVECVKHISPKKLLEMRAHLIIFYTHNGLQKTSTPFLRMPIRHTIHIE